MILSCKNDKLQVTTLKNGMKVATYYLPEKNSVGIFLQVYTGALNENKENNGVAHFLEHLAFQGTSKRTSEQLWKEMSDKGGYMNAHTDYTEIAYKIKVLKDDLDFGIDVMSDIIQNPLFEEKSIEKERGVILQEILTYEDNQNYLFEDISRKAVYKNTPLELKVGGEIETVKQINKQQILDFFRTYYFGENMILSVSGNVKHKDVVKMAEKYFNKIESRGQKTSFPVIKYNSEGGLVKQYKDNNKVLFGLLFKGVSVYDEKRHDIQIILDILCNGMSSRLYSELRQKRGLVYGIGCTSRNGMNEGIISLSFSTTSENLVQAYDTTIEELIKFRSSLTENEVNEAVYKYKVYFLMSKESDSTLGRASSVASSLLFLDRYYDYDDSLQQIQSVNFKSVLSTFDYIIEKAKTEKPFIAIYGKYDEKKVPDYSKLNTLWSNK